MCGKRTYGYLGVKIYSNKIYNLDMILAVGYRVKSPNGIIFRKWATSILKDYIIKGYALNERKLKVLNKVNSSSKSGTGYTINQMFLVLKKKMVN